MLVVVVVVLLLPLLLIQQMLLLVHRLMWVRYSPTHTTPWLVPRRQLWLRVGTHARVVCMHGRCWL